MREINAAAPAAGAEVQMALLAGHLSALVSAPGFSEPAIRRCRLMADSASSPTAPTADIGQARSRVERQVPGAISYLRCRPSAATHARELDDSNAAHCSHPTQGTERLQCSVCGRSRASDELTVSALFLSFRHPGDRDTNDRSQGTADTGGRRRTTALSIENGCDDPLRAGVVRRAGSKTTGAPNCRTVSQTHASPAALRRAVRSVDYGSYGGPSTLAARPLLQP